MAASIAPAAPSVWPIWPLDEETNTSGRWSPKQAFKARVSIASFKGVPVPCAFTYATSDGAIPAQAIALRMTRAAVRPSASGFVM